MKTLSYDGLDHVVDKIYDLINSGGSADYIVEEGKSGIWTYRKWASGIAECWGVYSYNTAISSAWGNAYEGAKAPQQSYPFTFIERPFEQGLLFSKGNVGHWTEQFEANTTSKSGTYFPVRPSSMTTSSAFELQLYVKGFWKEFTPSMSDRVYKSFGSYTTVSGTMTTKAWTHPDSTTTWTAPQDGLYIISMHIVTQNDTSYTSAYKMFRWFGTATPLTDISGLYFRGTTDGAQYGINGSAWSFPVLARQGQTVKSSIWTGAVFTCDVQICGILVGDYR